MVEAVIFDLGGTLFRGKNDFEKAVEAQYEALQERGYDLSWSRFEEIARRASARYNEKYHGDYRRFDYGSFMEIFFDIWGKDASTEEMAAVDRVFRETLVDHQYLDEHAESVLHFCHNRNFFTGVITNGNEMMTWRRLQTAGIADEFDLVLYSTAVQAEKSTVEPFRVFLEKTGFDGSDCVMVGDRLDEDMWATEVGMTTVYLSGRSSTTHGEERDPDHTITELDELKPILDALAS